MELKRFLLLNRPYNVFLSGLWRNNPIFRQVLGICSTLAVTNKLTNTLVMCGGLLFTVCLSNITVSALRNVTPRRVRMMVQTLIIASYVIVIDILLKAYLPDISDQLGPYVGLIITNCIVMGRLEAFASSSGPWLSFWDGLGSSLGYSFILIGIAMVREPMGLRTLAGIQILGDWWKPWTIMVMAPSAFFLLALFVWVCRLVSPAKGEVE